jgi:dihydroorotase
MSSLSIINGRLIDPHNDVDEITDIEISNGRISAIGKAAASDTDIVIDASNKIVCPGLVDLCARLREPGSENKASIHSETIAASAAGITTVCCPPDTDPVIDEPAVIDLINHKATNSAHSNVVTLGALTVGLQGERLAEMQSLHNAGCVGVSNAHHPVDNTMVLRRAYAYAANCGFTVHITPTDHWLSKGGCAHEGSIATRLGLKGIPVSAETTALARVLELVAETGVHAHIGRLSSAQGIELIRHAKARGLAVTADVSAHQLHLTELDISNFNADCHVLPPLRTQRDMEALRQAVADGTIDAICSDHQPHNPDAKQAPFASTEPGISSLETLLSLTLKLVHENLFDYNTAIKTLTSAPANILGINKGKLAVDDIADICIFNPDAEWQVDTSEMLSRGKNTPFEGWMLQGKATHTIINGRQIYPA